MVNFKQIIVAMKKGEVLFLFVFGANKLMQGI